ncbi:receptor-type tyrosine-protein phosphatase kappa-like [Haliotis asinina]|uniref:receptor-type tyrosine-protein phosphatase kappa-like n=1 Tax=Haliotis asinina TaxID=109174 RepID=UPI0035319851
MVHNTTEYGRRLIEGTTDLRCIICLYTLVTAINGDQTDGATCRDASPKLCLKRLCGQPGIAERCRKTCGRCNVTDCPVGMYRKGDSCTQCHRQTQDDHDECTRTCPITGRWGEACNKHCGAGCRSLVCYQWSGECVDGCTEGRYGQQCEINCDHCRVCGYGVSNCARRDGSCSCGCSGNLYGATCDKQCNSKCLNTSCNSTTGECTHGCIEGMFGRHCNSDCSDTCLHGTCHQNGSCMACMQGYYGEQCRKKCSRNCGSETCIRDGKCNPCKPGFFKPQCQEKCSDNCLNETCNQNNGKCDYGCVWGWHGDTCSVKCPENCATDKCSRDNGSCSDGCVAGTYGQHCRLTCSSSCRDMECATNDTGKTSPGFSTTNILGSALPCILLIVFMVLVVFVRKRNRVQNISKGRHGFHNDSANNSTTMPLIYPSHQLTSRESTEHHEDDVSFPTEQTSDGNVLIHVHTSKHSTISWDEDGCGSGFDSDPCHVPDSSPSNSVWPTEVSVQDLRKYVEHMKKTGGFAMQCTELPRGKLGSCFQAELPENTAKNRYRNVLAYDHCRVKLTPIPNMPGSDYINASYIHGYGEPQDFVATQGPYEDVIRDFWKMAWETNASKIVMLTNCVENRKAKCEKYWPDFGHPGTSYDDVHVQCVAEEELMDYTVRTFSVHREAELPRKLKQYHFTAWPDKGVPEDVGTLVDFHRMVKKEQSTGKGPTIVHCSAGIGRTGTWIALDYLIAQAKAEGVVDVFECIVRLRHQRMNVVQTTEQYVFLHEALMEALPTCDRLRPIFDDNGTGDYENVETLTV